MRSANILFVLIGLSLVGGAGRLVFIEYSQGDQLRSRAEKQQKATITIPAQRGDILDSRSRVFAGVVRRPSIFLDPAMIDDPANVAASLGPVFGINVDELRDLILDRKNSRFVWLSRDVTDEQFEQFKALRERRYLPGVGYKLEPRRQYPFGRTAAHVLGFVGTDGEGVPDQLGGAGVELEFDALLKGRPGHRCVTYDGGRRRVRSDDDSYQPPEDGASVVLTIDAHIQQRAEQHLAEAVSKYKAEWGAAVVMDPHTGEVLAMAISPDFDPDDPMPAGLVSGSKEHEKAQELLRNRAISDAYEPGSIFKPFVFCSALNDGFADLDREYEINGPVHMFGRRKIKDTHAYGVLPGYKIISKSSNIGMGMIGAVCGNERMNLYVRRLGFGEQTGIELPGESPGLVNDPSKWTSYSTQSIPIGQEIGITSIQIITAFSTFANGGVLYKPRIVRGILDSKGNVLADNSQPVPIREVFSADVADEFRKKALVSVVSREGTGRRAILPNWQLFGKTGTAQVARTDGKGYEPGAYTGSFICGAPSDNPRVVVLVSLFKPKGGIYYGGQVAAPAAAQIVSDTLHYLHVPDESRSAAEDGREAR